MTETTRAPAAEEAAFYERFWGARTAELSGHERARWAVIAELLAAHVAPPVRALDVGCGRGWITDRLRALGAATGIDPHEPAVARARELFPECRFERALPEELLGREGGGGHDLIVASEVVEHVPDKLAFLGTLHALLAPGGLLLLTTPRGLLWETWKERYSGVLQPVEQWCTEGELDDLLERAGFSVVERRRVPCRYRGMGLGPRLALKPPLRALLERCAPPSWRRRLLSEPALYQVALARRRP